ncbi:MAG: type II toxin-antitoxin system PemK/MazF family toxin [Methylococcales bacterium]|nr:type II toxin-antitoxin system PemK/MazF family toxin [Methylococcales bacterium]
MVKCGEVYWVNLDPTFGTEIKKTRPALIVSPNDLNEASPRVIIAPLTSKGQPLGCRPEINFNNRPSRLLLDQIRSVDKRHLLEKIGEIDEKQWHPILLEMLA